MNGIKTELLAPAGSPEICRAVIAAGADAVYLGGLNFGARAYAENFDAEQLRDILDFAHLHQKKIYLTVNTLLKNRELEEQLYDTLYPLYEQGLDAVIVQDLGAASWIRSHFPDLPLHASTQMSVTSAAGVRMLRKQGFRRVVTARELSLDEIKLIREETDAEIESFVHGALCYCFSGQCLFSSIIGGRSGNRGRCAQPCRLPYRITDKNGLYYNNEKEIYPLSPKDLCALHLLPDMIQAGIFSFKIEGRMKQLEYAAGVTAVYRKYLNRAASGEAYFAEKADEKRLMDLGNRNGFTEGYYKSRNEKSVLSLTASAHQSDPHPAPAETEQRKIPVSAKIRIRINEPMMLCLSACGQEIAVYSDQTVQPALNRPVTKADVEKQLRKTGGTEFELVSIEEDLDENAFVTVRALNELRRAASAALLEKLLQRYRRNVPAGKHSDQNTAESSGGNTCSQSARERAAGRYSPGSEKADGSPCPVRALVRTKEQLSVLLKKPYITGIYAEKINISMAEQIHAAGMEAYYAFPYIFRADAQEKFQKRAGEFAACRFDGLLVRSYDSLGFSKERMNNFFLIADQSLYTYNNRSVRAFSDSGCSLLTVPYELNEKELRHRDNARSEMIVYGWIPLMHSALCVYKNFDTCRGDAAALYLEDRYRNRFRVAKDCETCYNTILNDRPLSLFRFPDQIRRDGFASLRLEFLAENARETAAVLEDFEDAFPEICRTQTRSGSPDHTMHILNHTSGHFRRGVE